MYNEIDNLVKKIAEENKELAAKLELLVSKGIAYDQVRWERDTAESQLNEIGCTIGQKMDFIKKAMENPLASFTNLFIGYNKEENFRILICAWDESEAEELAEGYRIDAKMDGKFVISEPQTDDCNDAYSCDYVISSGDNHEGLINRNDYVAIKLWDKEDIRGIIIEEGYEGTDEEVEAVAKSREIRGLTDCDDGEWELIRYAVEQTLAK